MDDLYRFIHAWVPNLYGELDENYWLERGYILSDTDTDLSPELSPHESGEGGDSTEESKARDGQGDDITELTRESWEVSTLYFSYLGCYNTRYRWNRATEIYNRKIWSFF